MLAFRKRNKDGSLDALYNKQYDQIMLLYNIDTVKYVAATTLHWRQIPFIWNAKLPFIPVD
jgi:hypothetical protein